MNARTPVHLSILCPYCGARKQRRGDKACKRPYCVRQARRVADAKRAISVAVTRTRADQEILNIRRPLTVGALECSPMGGMGVRIHRRNPADSDEDDVVVVPWSIAAAITEWTIEQFAAVQEYIRAQRH